jgi:alkaline phosphatase|mmetsp:Transcript_32203/g.42658  ORF Transcript_32203/g.42658 Transcript_32203/m.42658 type:complete len:115 (+) Transcript_32203:543-887(+)
MLRARLFNRAGRKEVISNKTNFRDIENPFADHSMTLQTIKKEKHEAWKVRKHEKSLKLKSQIADMERKLHIYRIYKDELGVSLSKSERENVLNRFDSTGVELLMGRKMFTIRQT